MIAGDFNTGHFVIYRGSQQKSEGILTVKQHCLPT